MLRPRTQSTLASLLLALVAFGCGDCGGKEYGDGDGTGQDGGNGDGGNGGPVVINDGAPEECDGVDNDLDGIIDNVDKGRDGVCDCLKVATLGYRGHWGTGDVFATWLSSKSNNGATSLEGQVLTTALLAPYQVIVVQDVRDDSPGQSGENLGIGRSYSADEVEALRAWVQNGGGLMTVTGFGGPSEVVNVNRLLAAFSMSYGNQQILPKSGNVTVPVTGWKPHPISNQVAQVGVDNGYPVRGGTLLAFQPQEGNYDVGRYTELGKGHVFAWGDEWITYDTEWTLRKDIYQVERFWVQSLKWLTNVAECQVAEPIG